MATKTVVKIYSDLSGQEIGSKEGTVSFAFDGTGYEIDLTSTEKAELEKALAKFIKAARPAAGRRSTPPGVDPKTVRQWAIQNGKDVPSRGRIPGVLVEEYLASR